MFVCVRAVFLALGMLAGAALAQPSPATAKALPQAVTQAAVR